MSHCCLIQKLSKWSFLFFLPTEDNWLLIHICVPWLYPLTYSAKHTVVVNVLLCVEWRNDQYMISVKGLLIPKMNSLNLPYSEHAYYLGFHQMTWIFFFLLHFFLLMWRRLLGVTWRYPGTLSNVCAYRIVPGSVQGNTRGLNQGLPYSRQASSPPSTMSQALDLPFS